MNVIDLLKREQEKQEVPILRSGDTVRVHVKVVEGTRERIQVFEGVVIARQGQGRALDELHRAPHRPRCRRRAHVPRARSAHRQDRGAASRPGAPRKALLPPREGRQACPHPRAPSADRRLRDDAAARRARCGRPRPRSSRRSCRRRRRASRGRRAPTTHRGDCARRTSAEDAAAARRATAERSRGSRTPEQLPPGRPLKDRVGHAGEVAALAYLKEQGFRILARDWRCRIGQIDIVAEDGETLVLIEVKARRGTGVRHAGGGGRRAQATQAAHAPRAVSRADASARSSRAAST